MEEIMKNPWLYIGCGIAFLTVVSYAIYRRLFVSGDKSDEDGDNTSPNQFRCSQKKHIETLSYEFLVEEVKMMITQIDASKIKSDSVLSMAVTPNKLALQFVTQPNSGEWLGDIELTEEEKQKMVILSIKDTDNVLLSEILVASEVMDNYYDFVPDDKIYIKKIKFRK